MHAIQPPRPLRSVEPFRRTKTRAKPSSIKQPHRSIALEAAAKLTVNLLLIVAAGSAIVKLLPYNLSQQAKLQDLRSEVGFVEGRVDRVQADFSRNFDPQQARSVMQEQSSRVDPRQRPVVWLTPAQKTSPNP